MRIILIILLSGFCFSAMSQTYSLVAEKNRRTTVLITGNGARITYQDGESSKMYKGRLIAVNQNEIEMHSFNGRDSLIIPVSSILGYKKILRTGRAITGTLAGIGVASGFAMIADDQSTHDEIFDGLEAGLGVTLMVLMAIPYSIVMLSEPGFKTSNGFVFKSIPDRR